MESTSRAATRLGGCSRAALALLVGASALSAQPADTPDVRELVERERVRATIENAYGWLQTGFPDRESRTEAMFSATEQIVSLGPAALEFLVPQLDGLDRERVLFTLYVLGRLGMDEAAEPLRELVEKSHLRGNDRFSRLRKAWACYALAMLGEPDAVVLLDADPVPAGHVELARELSFLDAAAMLTAPASVGPLKSMFESYGDDASTAGRRWRALEALGRVADASLRPYFLDRTDDDQLRVREVALETLGRLGRDETAERRLLEALADPVESVRKAAANGLEAMAPLALSEKAVARLQTETHSWVRAVIYRLLVETRGEQSIGTLIDHWGRPDGLDRMWLVEAVGLGRLSRGLNLVREALRDPDVRVALRAVQALVDIGTPAATEALLRAANSAAPPIRIAALEKLSASGERRAASRAHRFLLEELAESPSNLSALRYRIEALCAVLERFAHIEGRETLRTAAASYDDPAAREAVTRTLAFLDRVAARGRDHDFWIERAASADPETRTRALRYLGTLGDDRAIGALVAAFDDAEDPDRETILRQLAWTASPRGAPLVTRVLTDPRFDTVPRRPIRDQAAWAARRIGGEPMIAALRGSALRRQGRDFAVLAYLAATAGADALETLRAVRIDRLRYPTWDRGLNQNRLESTIRRLERGRGVRSLDLPPDALALTP